MEDLKSTASQKANNAKNAVKDTASNVLHKAEDSMEDLRSAASQKMDNVKRSMQDTKTQASKEYKDYKNYTEPWDSETTTEDLKLAASRNRYANRAEGADLGYLQDSEFEPWNRSDSTTMENTKRAASETADSAKKSLKDAASDAWNKSEEFLEGLQSTAAKKVDDIKETLKDAKDKVLNKTEDVKDDMQDAKNKAAKKMDRAKEGMRDTSADIWGKSERAVENMRGKKDAVLKNTDDDFIRLPELNDSENIDDWDNLVSKYNMKYGIREKAVPKGR